MQDKDLMPVPPRNVLAKLGVSAITYLVGGAFLMAMTLGSRVRFLAISLSVVALVIGLSALFSRDQEDRKPGFIIAAAGVLGLVAQFGLPFMQPIAATILGFSGLGLLVAGVGRGIQFLLGLKKLKSME